MNISLVHRADIQDLEVWMSADEGKVSKSRPQMQGDQSIPIDSVKFSRCSSSKERSVAHSVSRIQSNLGEECRQSSQGCSEGRFGLIGDDSLDWLLRKGWGNKAKSSCKGMRLEMSAFT